ncbi:unnamed protein product, partial [Larinioides sclopetarius]
QFRCRYRQTVFFSISNAGDETIKYLMGEEKNCEKEADEATYCPRMACVENAIIFTVFLGR